MVVATLAVPVQQLHLGLRSYPLVKRFFDFHLQEIRFSMVCVDTLCAHTWYLSYCHSVFSSRLEIHCCTCNGKEAPLPTSTFWPDAVMPCTVILYVPLCRLAPENRIDQVSSADVAIGRDST